MSAGSNTLCESSQVVSESFIRGLGGTEGVAELLNKDLLLNQDRLQKELAVKDEALRNMQKLLSEIDAASPRRPRLEGSELVGSLIGLLFTLADEVYSNIFLEKMFKTRGPSFHAFPSLFTSNDWESNTDGKTQLILSMLRMATGLHVLSLRAQCGIESFVTYSASCRLDIIMAYDENLRTCHHCESLAVMSTSVSPVVSGSPLPAIAKSVRSSAKAKLSRKDEPLPSATEEPPVEVSFVDPSEIPLLLDMPWATDYIFDRGVRCLLLPTDLRVMATSLLQELSRARDTNGTCRAVLENKARLYDNQKSVGSLSTILFGFRFLDIACSLKRSADLASKACDSETLRLRPLKDKTMLVGSSGKLRGVASLCESTQGWPRVLRQLHSCMQLDGGSVQPISQASEAVDDPSRRLLATAFRLLDAVTTGDVTSTVNKARCNLDAAAFMSNFMFRVSKQVS
ncbi:hypothetical protein VNI00_017719 [Paramarasmius palmivorus]|uniref:Uncharacterized protein n=1 Tax=Paramarasmius palmivorus TaxID=297713 RepID=A0AAW0B503_9AGAR